jgi:spore coat polysaccharide biosynthesis protein SpsF
VLGKPLLEYEAQRLLRCRRADALVVATTTAPADDAVAALCGRLGLSVFRGPEQDVLSRYEQAARAHRAEAVVRVTADCPLIDPAVVDEVVGFFLERAGEYDYVSNTLTRTWPRGMDVEVFHAAALREAAAEAREPAEREHVTPFMYRRGGRFRVGQVLAAQDLSRHRWTVDTPEDFELVRRLLEELAPRRPAFAMGDVLRLLEANPAWMTLNAGVAQREIVA